MQNVLITLFLFHFTLLSAQEPNKYDLQPCGTAPYIDPWLEAFRAGQVLANDRNSDTLFVALKVHLVGNDMGGGRFSAERLLNAFCRLNNDFAPANIRFYMKDDWNLLNSTKYYNHNDITDGIEMMLNNNVPDAVNSYFMANPAGNCGYNLPYAGVAISHSCAGMNDHTWAHEVGHNFTLPHPFIGWEGKVYNFSTPTPTFLTYDYTHFHAAPEPFVPAPLDTALVELLDKSNCTIASDKFCDTPPDYLSYRWDCNAQNQSTVLQKDPAGAQFYSDGSLYMSYSFDHCQSRFSPDEIAAMRNNLLSVKSKYLDLTGTVKMISEVPALLTPTNGELIPREGYTFEWTAVPNAEKYVVQGSRVPSFSFRDFEAVVSGTNYTSGILPANANMYWRVRPFNSTFACTNFSPNANFKTASVSSIESVDKAKEIKIYPNPASKGLPLILDFGKNLQQTLLVKWADQQGRLLTTEIYQLNGSHLRLENLTQNAPSGLYQLILVFENETLVKRVFLN